MTHLPPTDFVTRLRGLERDVARLQRHRHPETNAFGQAVGQEVSQVGTATVPPAAAVVPHPQNVTGKDPWVPSKPVISVLLGVLAVTWDGHGAMDEDIPSNFAWIEVHRSMEGPEFETGPLTRVGHLRASGTATFSDQVYGDIWYYRFVMVNAQSQPSDPSEASIGVLVQVADADIITVSADKMITGELQAGVRIIAGPESGTHAEVTSEGIRSYVDDPVDGTPNEVVRLGTNDNDVLGITNSLGQTVGSWDENGRIAATALNVGDDGGPVWAVDDDGNTYLFSGVEIYGTEFTEWFDDNGGGRGALARANRMDTPSTYSATETKYLELQIPDIRPGRLYSIRVPSFYMDSDTSGGDSTTFLRYAWDGAAVSTSSPNIGATRTNHPGGKSYRTGGIEYLHDSSAQVVSERELRLLLSYGAEIGNSRPVATSGFPVQIIVEDIGPAVPDSGIDYSVTTPPTVRKSYVTYWYATNSESYRGNGTARTDTPDLVQGYDPSGFNGDGHAVTIFGGNSFKGSEVGVSLATAMTGATLVKAEVYFFFDHWFYNTGGTAILRPWNSTSLTGASATPTGTAIKSSAWANPGGRLVNITPIASTSIRGVRLGKSGGTNLLYYGRARGHTVSSGKPYLKLTYTREV